MIQDKPAFEFKPVVNNNMFTDTALEYRAKRDLIENPSITKKYVINKGIFKVMSQMDKALIELDVAMLGVDIEGLSDNQIVWLATRESVM